LPKPRKMITHCVILAAGFNTRIASLTEGKPKALLPFNSTTILGHTIERVEEIAGIQEIVLATNELFRPDFEEWLRAHPSKIPIKLISNGVSVKEDARGAIKDAWWAIEQAGLESSDVLIVGCDNIMPVSLESYAQNFIKDEYSRLIVSDYHSVERVKKLGVPVLDADEFVVEYEEKPEQPKTTLGGALIFFIKGKDLPHLQQISETPKDNIGHFLEVLSSKRRLKAWISPKEIIDIGSPEDYALATKQF